jgi:glutathionyl-hydroquinone reductase
MQLQTTYLARNHGAGAGNNQVKTALGEVSNTGAFNRTASVFRDFVTDDGSSQYPAEAGRYLLYVSYACPWASRYAKLPKQQWYMTPAGCLRCRCLAVRALKGLQEAVAVAVTSPVWERTKPEQDEHTGWVFDTSFPGATSDPMFGARTLREVYEKGGGSRSQKFTVPVLFDTRTKQIVNNESADIIRMFNKAFNAFAKRPGAHYTFVRTYSVIICASMHLQRLTSYPAPSRLRLINYLLRYMTTLIMVCIDAALPQSRGHVSVVDPARLLQLNR